MNKAVSGFTLIELVVVITILGILVAFAFPRFAALDVEARKAVVDGLGGSVRSASLLAHSLSLVRGSPATITMDGVTITMENGYPDKTSIDDALQDLTGFTVTIAGGTVTFTKTDGANPATCIVTYDEADVGDPPEITVDTTGC